MASRIKGITVEIGGDTTGLEKALKNVNSTIKSTQSENCRDKRKGNFFAFSKLGNAVNLTGDSLASPERGGGAATC